MDPDKLSDLNPGDTALVDRFLSEDPAFRRLRELGMLRGTRIEFIRKAPLGGPIEISVRGSLLSIRKEEAEMIAVNSIESTAEEQA